MTNTSNTKTIHRDEFLNSLLDFSLEKIYELYEPDSSDDGSRFKAYIEQQEKESTWNLVVLLHPLFIAFDKALEVKGYEHDYAQWSVFESLLASIVDVDKDRSYDLNFLFEMIYEDLGKPINITARDSIVLLFNDFAKNFLKDYEKDTQVFLTNGKEGKTIVLDFI